MGMVGPGHHCLLVLQDAPHLGTSFCPAHRAKDPQGPVPLQVREPEVQATCFKTGHMEGATLSSRHRVVTAGMGWGYSIVLAEVREAAKLPL